MKKLNKSSNSNNNTVAAFCACFCTSCTCGCYGDPARDFNGIQNVSNMASSLLEEPSYAV